MRLLISQARHCRRWHGIILLAVVCSVVHTRQAHAQFVRQQVGGVSIDAKGIVTNVRVDELNQFKRERRRRWWPVPGDLKAVALRKISLRQLEAAIAEHRDGGTPISDDMRYLAGMQRMQYVFVYPEQQRHRAGRAGRRLEDERRKARSSA